MAFLFHRIHPLNAVPALVLSRFGEVWCYQREFLPAFISKQFRPILIDDYFTLEEFHDLNEKIYSEWKEFCHSPDAKWNLKVSIAGVEVDFGALRLQWLSSQLEDNRIFSFIANRFAKRCRTFVFPDHSHNLERNWSSSSYGEGVLRLELNFLDRAWLYLKSVVSLLKACIGLLRSVSKVESNKTLECVWIGISPSEIPTGAMQLDFSAFIREFPPDKQLFMTPKPLANSDFLQRKHLRCSSVQGFRGLFSIKERVLLVVAIFSDLARACFARRIHWKQFPFLINCIATGAPWVRLATKYRPKFLMLTLSALWPEPPAVAICNAVGVRTVCWFYGLNVYRFCRNPHFIDQQIRLAILETREIWTWCEAMNQYVKRRQIPRTDRPPMKYCVTGPVMFGDSQLIHEQTSALRGRFGVASPSVKRWIALFDVPTVSREAKAQLGTGPTAYPIEQSEAFFFSCISLLKKFPELGVIYKPKRNFLDSSREMPASLWTLIDPQGEWMQANRVHLLSHNADPYLGIALCDLAIGLPFTSPVVVSAWTGRPSYFFDPLNIAAHYAVVRKQYEPMRLKTLGELERAVQSDVPVYSLEEGDRLFAFGPAGDPITRMRSLVVQ